MNWETVSAQLTAWLLASLPKFGIAVLILALGWWLSGLVVRLMRHALQRSKADAGIVSFLGSLTNAILKVVVVVTALSQLGMNVTSIVAALGAAGVTVGLALKDNMSNIASGAQIIFTKPFRVGDYLAIDKAEGTVERLEIMFTTLRTFDNKEIVIPNSIMTDSVITNYTAMEKRRLDLIYQIGYHADLQKAKAVLSKVCDDCGLAMADPAPIIAVGKHNQSSINLDAKLWCKTADYWPLYWHMQEQVKVAFDKHGITFPYDQLDVHLISGSAETKPENE